MKSKEKKIWIDSKKLGTACSKPKKNDKQKRYPIKIYNCAIDKKQHQRRHIDCEKYIFCRKWPNVHLLLLRGPVPQNNFSFKAPGLSVPRVWKPANNVPVCSRGWRGGWFWSLSPLRELHNATELSISRSKLHTLTNRNVPQTLQKVLQRRWLC